MTPATLLEKHISLYSELYQQCLKSGTYHPDTCQLLSAESSLSQLAQNLASRGPNCGIDSYVAIVAREIGLPKMQMTAKEGSDYLIERAAKKALDTMWELAENYAVPLSGCLVGGTLTSVGGGIIGFTSGGLPGAGLGAAISFPRGCAVGTAIAVDAYVIYKGAYKIKETHDTIKSIAQKLWDHHAQCNANSLNSSVIPNTLTPISTLAHTPIIWDNPLLQTPILWQKKIIAEAKEVIHLPKARTIGQSKQQIEILQSIPPRPQVVTTPLPPLENSYTFYTPEDIAQKFIDIAGDLTGITPVISQAKALKGVFIEALSNPENAPKLLVKQVISEPKQIFQKIISSPKEFLANSENFLKDPTLAGALGVVGAAFSIVSLANSVLPLLTKVSREAFKNPLSVPLVVSKELLKLTASKVIGVFKLAQGLVCNPLKTLEQLGKSVLRSPKELLRNVKCLVGLGRSKRKKAKKKAKQLALLQAQAQQQMQIEMEQARKEVIRFFPDCYNMAQQQWMIPENREPEDYFSALVQDWRAATETGRFFGSCGKFMEAIQLLLTSGNFSEVVRISPMAHSENPTPPLYIWHMIAEYAQTNLLLACEVMKLERHTFELHKSVYKLSISVENFENEHQQLNNQVQEIEQRPSLSLTTTHLQNHVETLANQNHQLQQNKLILADRLRGRMSPERINALMTNLTEPQ